MNCSCIQKGTPTKSSELVEVVETSSSRLSRLRTTIEEVVGGTIEFEETRFTLTAFKVNQPRKRADWFTRIMSPGTWVDAVRVKLFYIVKSEDIHWHALRHLNNSLMLEDEGVDVKTRMDRLGHTQDRVNIIYSHAGDQAQLAASEAVWQKLKPAESELKQKPAVP